MHRVINITLDPASISAGIHELDLISAELRRRTGQLIERLAQDGANIARAQVMMLGAVYTGNLLNSIEGYYDEASHVGIIRANSPHAVYVEYGTGIAGNANPHPDPKGWIYDINGHGGDGWVYLNPNDGMYHLTAGMAARPFMHNTLMELEALCQRIAREVFA